MSRGDRDGEDGIHGKPHQLCQVGFSYDNLNPIVQQHQLVGYFILLLTNRRCCSIKVFFFVFLRSARSKKKQKESIKRKILQLMNLRDIRKPNLGALTLSLLDSSPLKIGPMYDISNVNVHKMPVFRQIIIQSLQPRALQLSSILSVSKRNVQGSNSSYHNYQIIKIK